MALTSTPVAQELLSVLAELFERGHPDFGPWCRPADADAVRSAIIDRSDDLRKQIDRAVRLMRLAAQASETDYTEFIYLAVPVLRPRLFKAAVEKAIRSGRLADSLVDIEPDGIRLREPAMALHASLADKGYGLSYSQMVVAAIMLDVLHNTLGYHVVAEVAGGLTIRGPAKVGARDIASELRSRFNAWLAPRLESPHRRQQAKVLHAFLAARGELAPEKINDETVMAFWEGRALMWKQLRIAGKDAAAVATVERAARDEGFRAFRSVAIAILRYRRALIDAADAYGLDHAATSEAMLEHAHDGEAVQAINRWVNPLATLERASANGIKWLTDRELRWLVNCFGLAGTSGAHAGKDEDEDEIALKADGGLMQGRRFDLSFLRTLLRVDVFDRIQSSLIAGLKRRQSAADTLDRAISAIQEAKFSDAVERYAAIRDQLTTEALAALHILASAGNRAAVLLMEYLAEAEAMSELRRLTDEPDNVSPFVRPRATGQSEDTSWDEMADSVSSMHRLRRMGPALQTAFKAPAASGSLAKLVRDSRAARRRVNRSGFKPDDATSRDTVAVIARTAPAVLDLMRELDRILDRLGKDIPRFELGPDRQRFGDVLKHLYGFTDDPLC